MNIFKHFLCIMIFDILENLSGGGETADFRDSKGSAWVHAFDFQSHTSYLAQTFLEAIFLCLNYPRARYQAKGPPDSSKPTEGFQTSPS